MVAETLLWIWAFASLAFLLATDRASRRAQDASARRAPGRVVASAAVYLAAFAAAVFLLFSEVLEGRARRVAIAVLIALASSLEGVLRLAAWRRDRAADPD